MRSCGRESTGMWLVKHFHKTGGEWRVMSLEVFWRRGGALSDRALNNTLCVYRLSRGNAGNAAVVSAHLEDVMAASRDHDCSRFSCPAA